MKTISSLSTGDCVAISQKHILSDWQFWGKWILYIAVVSIIFLVTIDVAPFLHRDEFLIVDLGRIILHPNTEWAICWITNREQPAYLWFYLGPVLQELVFQNAGEYAPRVSGLIGAIAAATSMVGWLVTRGLSRNIAVLLGLIFLLDPVLVQSYTLGRVDGWAMAFCMCSCWAINTTAYKLLGTRTFMICIMLAGAFAALAFFTWPSAIFLFPLIFLELYYMAIKSNSANVQWSVIAAPLAIFIVSSLLMGLFLLFPIAPQLYAQFDDLIAALLTNTRSGSNHGEQLGNSMIVQLIELVRSLKFTPILTLVAIASAIIRRDIGLIIATLTAIFFMLITVVYLHRVQYLLPYFTVSVAGIYQLKYIKYKINIGFFANSLMLVLLSWSVALSLCIRSFLAIDGRAERNRDLIHQAAKNMIGPGNHTVYIPHEFYYAGRSLGWRMYAPYNGVGDTLSLEGWQRILPYVDYAITEEISEEFNKELNKEGMYYKGTYRISKNFLKEDRGEPRNINRLRNLYGIFRHPYKFYKLYVRENKGGQRDNNFCKD